MQRPRCREFPAFEGGPSAFYSRSVLPPASRAPSPAVPPGFESRPRNFARCMPRVDVVVGLSQATMLWPPPGEGWGPPQITHR